MSASIPVRGEVVRPPGLPVPPEPMPLVRARHLLKRWRWVGAFGADVALCAGQVRVGRAPRTFWAVAEPGRLLAARAGIRRGATSVEPDRVSVTAPGVAISLELDPRAPAPVESVSPSGARGYVWTRKQAGVPARGTVVAAGRDCGEVELLAVVDETAGYHERRTAWSWSAGVGRDRDGRAVGWNLVQGVNDDPEASERTVWVSGDSAHAAPVEFAADLSHVRCTDGATLRFEPWACFDDRFRLPPFAASRYALTFGRFEGELPGGVRLADGRGVMERHEALW